MTHHISRSHRWIFWVAVAIHAVWGGTLLLSPDPVNVTGLHVLATIIPSPLILGALMLVVAFFGAIASAGVVKGQLGAVFLTPQQVALWISAVGAIYYVGASHYADEVVRSRWFMLADQIPLVALTLGHTAALWRYYTTTLWTHDE